MARYAITIFLGSLLLFQVQPLIGKYILPWFGGGPAVWTTCMLCFQVMLLVGYAYAYLIDRWFSPFRQGLLHATLLAASLLLLPIVPAESWAPTGGQSPTWRILGLLAVTIGGPYVLLSATGPLLQSWFARTHPDRSPYRLYSLSNVGSLLALLSYPFLVEPALTLSAQAKGWSAAFAAFAVLCGLCALGICRWAGSRPESGQQHPTRPDDDPRQAPPDSTTVLIWIALTASGSTVLLATTNQMCQEVAVVPFLWVLPLALYLLTFIICFDSSRWYRRSWLGITLVLAVLAALALLIFGVTTVLWLQIVGYSFVLFVCCMVCHGELVLLKPAPRYLTTFYLMVAAGGALGGVFVTLIAPLVFPSYWEYHFGLMACCLLLLVSIYRDRSWPLHGGRPLWAWGILGAVFVALGITLALQANEYSRIAMVERRNFYGVLQINRKDVDQLGPHYVLRHGRISHGYQYLEGEQRTWPTSYYGPNTGVGMAVRHHPRRLAAEGHNGLRIGVVGLGVGTMAAYGRSGDLIRFYEINPEVVRLSNEYFSYCKDCRGQVEVVLGDARVSLRRELPRRPADRFDVLVVDAFNSDAIPIHLMTRECFELYWQHLRDDGILAVHISNRYLDLGPMVRRLAADLRKEAVLFDTYGDESQGVDAAGWVLVTGNREFLDSEEIVSTVAAWPEAGPLPQAWTDDFSNLLETLDDW